MIAFLFITALGQLPLANVTAILQATPLILTLLCVAFGLERVGRRRWAAVAVGFVGVLLIVKPSPAGFNAYAGIALLCAAVVAGRDLVTRFIPRDVPSVVIALSTTASVGLAGVLVRSRRDLAAARPPPRRVFSGRRPCSSRSATSPSSARSGSPTPRPSPRSATASS